MSVNPIPYPSPNERCPRVRRECGGDLGVPLILLRFLLRSLQKLAHFYCAQVGKGF
jgi:hypothetical protein